MPSLICPKRSNWKWVWPENKNMINLTSASFVVIMLLHKGLTRIHLQKSLSCILARVSLEDLYFCWMPAAIQSNSAQSSKKFFLLVIASHNHYDSTAGFKLALLPTRLHVFGLSHPSVRPSFRPYVCRSYSCEYEISRMSWGNFFQLGTDVHLDSRRN